MKTFLSLMFVGLCFLANAQETKIVRTDKPSFFYVRAQAGCVAGDAQAVSLNAASGYHYRFGLETGISIGREHYSSTYAPLLLEAAYSFPNWKSIRPFVGIYGGTLLSLSPYNYYRKPAAPCMGVKIGFTRNLTEHLGWTTSIGYRFMQLQEPSYYPLWLDTAIPVLTKINNHVAEIRIGLELR